MEGEAKHWFYDHQEDINTWEKCSKTFLTKFFPIGKTYALRGKITKFQQQQEETIFEAWERFKEYNLDCPHHGMEDWVIMQGFYHGLIQKSHEHLDAAAVGSFISLIVGKAKILIDKIDKNKN